MTMRKSAAPSLAQEAPRSEESGTDQWIFPISALRATPSQSTLGKELSDRARGVEFLFRLGSSLQL